jgi:thiamine biosynthesis lipoprotein
MTCEWISTAEHWRGHFNAMASPCEILIDTDAASLAERLYRLVREETLRIEHKYSRYRADSVTSIVNRSQGNTITVDPETALLLDYAHQCWQLSEGQFDITSGVLRKVWLFDGSDRLPSADAVARLMPRIGWQRLQWHNPQLHLPAGMELDFGGIGKEYAVDRCAQLCAQHSDTSVLINFGGDLYSSGPRRGDKPWLVGIDDPRRNDGQWLTMLALRRGAVATSGDARRYLLCDGIRYGHILNPQTGWPVPDAPRSVTVLAETCVEAGMLATFAMLQGRQAESFLQQQGVRHWCAR